MTILTPQQQKKSDIAQICDDFPILREKIQGKRLAYLDNAATTQKPRAVIEAITQYYYQDNANVHRGVHQLADRATQAYENARQAVKNFIHARHAQEIIFVRGATEAINLVAQCFAINQIEAGDEIVISRMEHHSNWLPWQVVCERVGAQLKIAPLTAKGEIDLPALQQLLSSRVKLVAVSHVSHVLGTVNPVAEIIQYAHAQNIPVLLDGAQAVAHMPINVQVLDCDFYAFSGHKIYAPTGIGVLYAKEKWLEKLPPYHTGGGMIEQIAPQQLHFKKLAEKFEAGTPNIAGAVGLHAAIHYLQNLDWQSLIQHEQQLLKMATQQLTEISGLTILGNAENKIGVISFVMQQAHPHDIATIFDSEGVAIRAGHHCAMPLMKTLHVPATARISFGIYNTEADVMQLRVALEKVQAIFA